MKQLAVLLLTGLLLSSGCIQGSKTSPSAGSASSGMPTPGASTTRPIPTDWPVGPSGTNITDCQGAFSDLDLPNAVVQDNLPSNYTLSGEVRTFLRLELNLCKKVSVDGVDVGPASIALLRVPIKAPTSPKPRDGTVTWFVFEIITDNPALAGWLLRSGLQASFGNVSHRFSPQPEFLGEVESAVTNGSKNVYSVHGFPYQTLMAVRTDYRYFYGPDPLRDYWEGVLFYSGSEGLGPGRIEMAPDSRISKITDGMTNGAPLTSVMNRVFQLMVDPSAEQM